VWRHLEDVSAADLVESCAVATLEQPGSVAWQARGLSDEELFVLDEADIPVKALGDLDWNRALREPAGL
jgi:hypothetical protein